MVCIYCGNKTKTNNSRSSKKTPSTWRRRECLSCKAIFSTRETPDFEASLRYRNSISRLEPFYKEKLLMSLNASLSHRSDCLPLSVAACGTIVGKLLSLSRNGVVDRPTVISTAVTVLERLDRSSSVHYRAHHPIS